MHFWGSDSWEVEGSKEDREKEKEGEEGKEKRKRRKEGVPQG